MGKLKEKIKNVKKEMMEEDLFLIQHLILVNGNHKLVILNKTNYKKIHQKDFHKSKKWINKKKILMLKIINKYK